MASTQRLYRRLPGTGYQILGRRIQLWEGAEHLLLVEWDGHREYYKRFDYRDIQAFIIRKTNAFMIRNAIFGALFCIFLALGIGTSELGGRIFLLIISAVVGIFLLANAIAGPSCRCSIRTAVQTNELLSLSRFRATRKVLARLRPLIASAQGELRPDEIGARMREPQPSPLLASEIPAPTPVLIDDPNAPPKIV
jgi:hypothetical protein